MSKSRDLGEFPAGALDIDASGNLDVTGDVSLADNDKLILGDGSDLEIFHDGANSYISDNGTGNLYVRASDNMFFQSSDNVHRYAEFINGGAVKLRFDNSHKMQTTATGINVTGTVTADGLTVDGAATVSGNVGIGNSDPAVPLDVRKAGGGNFIANFQNTTAGTPYGVSIKDAVGGASGYPLFQVTNSAGSVAHLKVMSGTGDVIVGSGVYLGGTGAANKLDDYEEGTWTPSQIGLGAVGNVISAYYRKVGDLVFFTVDITAAITSNTGPFQLVLPFTPVGFSTIQLTATSLAYTTSSATVAEVQGGSGLMFRTSHNGGTMTNAALSNARIIASGSYIPI